MTLFSKTITINLGNYESIKLGVSEAPSFAICDKQIIQECKDKGISVDRKIRQALGWLEG